MSTTAALWVLLCTTSANWSAAPVPPCTPVIGPQSRTADRTACCTVIHTRPMPARCARAGCPQIAQPLILILRSLRSFLFEVRPWGHSSLTPAEVAPQRGLSPSTVSFQVGLRSSTVVVRLLLRPSWRITEPAAFVTEGPQRRPGELGTDLDVTLGEGTQWTRLQHGLSPT